MYFCILFYFYILGILERKIKADNIAEDSHFLKISHVNGNDLLATTITVTRANGCRSSKSESTILAAVKAASTRS